MSTLEHSDPSDGGKSAQAILYLLSLVFPRIPASVINARASQCFRVLLANLELYHEEGSQALLKAVSVS